MYGNTAINQANAFNPPVAPKDCTPVKKHVPLEDVSRFAEAIEYQASQVDAFCARFFGEPSCDGACKPVQSVQSGHSGQLARIGAAIDDLHKAVQRLSDIG